MGNQVICGDCLKVIPQLSDGILDAVISDPPYGQNMGYEGDDSVVEAGDLLSSFLKAVEPKVKRNGHVVIFWTMRDLDVCIDVLRSSGFMYRRTLTMYLPKGNARPYLGWLPRTQAIVVGQKYLPKQPTDFHTDMAVYLAEAVDKSGLSRAEIARRLGCDSRLVMKWTRVGDPAWCLPTPRFYRPLKELLKLDEQFDILLDREPVVGGQQREFEYHHDTYIVDDRNEKMLHPSQKPLSVIEHLVKCVAPEGGLVLDGFGGCYDDKTEVLTDSGWKFFKDVTAASKFLTRDVGGKLSYEEPSVLHKYDYDGKMISVKNRSIDLLVTPNHNMYVNVYNDLHYRKSTIPKFVRADELNLSCYKIPCGGCYVPTKDFLSKEFMYLIGLYVSEGYFEKIRGKYSSNLIICQNQGDKWNTMWNWLERLNPIKRSDRKIKIKLTPEMASFIRNNCGIGKYYKFLSEEILSNKHLECLFDAMILGDGNRCKNAICYYTTSKKLSDSFQELCIKLGFESTESIRTRNVSQINGRLIKQVVPSIEIGVRTRRYKEIYPKKHVSSCDYKGVVYCATVPNHTLYVRRNGKSTWCGNSGTTAVACKRTGRKFICIEVSPQFCDIAKERLEHEL